MTLRPPTLALLALGVLLVACRNDRQAATRADSIGAPRAQNTWLGYRDWTVSEHGIGPVLVGMTFAQADTALEGRFSIGDTVENECDYAGIDGVEDGISFLVGDGRIARVDVRDSTVATSRGIRVGDTDSSVQRAYPGLRREPHTYEDGQYLIVAPGAPRDTNHLLVFETDGRVVTSYRGGVRPVVLFVEGCS